MHYGTAIGPMPDANAGFLRQTGTVALGAAGTTFASTLACAGAPGTVRNPLRPLPQGLPPLLGVGTWRDFPPTARRVPGSGTVYHPGTGHELYATGNACVIRHVDRYLADGVVPHTRC